jgi:hypothetical protein
MIPVFARSKKKKRQNSGVRIQKPGEENLPDPGEGTQNITKITKARSLIGIFFPVSRLPSPEF